MLEISETQKNIDVINKKKTRVALTSIGFALFLTVTKLSVGILTNSLGILAEALHSGLDMIAAIITFIAVSFSGKGVDSDHHFGHGKIENFSALIETLILIITCGWIILEAVDRLLHPVIPEVNILSFLVIIIAIFVDYERSRLLYRVAKETRSQALEADALHFSTDILSSLVVIAGLVFVTIGFPIGDAIAALMVAVIVSWLSVKMGLSTINSLMDRVPMESYTQIKSFIEKEFPAYEIQRLRLRESGPEILGDLTLLIPSTVDINEFHIMRDTIHSRIQETFANVELLIVAHPKASSKSDKTLSTSYIQSLLQNITIDELNSFETHNVTYYSYDKKDHLDFHLLLPNELTLKEAHDISEKLKAIVMTKIPSFSSINIHLEPLKRQKNKQFDEISNLDRISDKINEFLGNINSVDSVQDVQLRSHKGRLIIFITIYLNGDMNLVDSHNVTEEIEKILFDQIPNIYKIHVHTIPS